MRRTGERVRRVLNKHFDSDIEIKSSKFQELNQSQTRYRLLVAAQSFHWIEWDKGLRKAASLLDDNGYLGLVFYSTKIVDESLRTQLDRIYSKYPAVPHVYQALDQVVVRIQWDK